ncbi:MAG TPA: GNAT family N-acetyltransferase [Sphingomicrobium sp.]|nr:GNAT family N-acetyltransferase [Sphingomicrobium sp.]
MQATTQTLVRVRKMQPEDIPAGRELSRQQEWPHRAVDWEFLFRQGSGFVAELDGQIVGTTMIWPYGTDAANLGMVIVSGEVQGQGIGRRLMEAALDALGDRNVRLNSTEEGRPLYTKLGFQPVGRIHQHQGLVDAIPLIALRPNERVRPAGKNDYATIAELDRRAQGVDRSKLIAAILETPRGIIFDSNNSPVGFAVLRRFGRGFSVGPTVAPDALAAKALISHWLGSKAGKFCRIDVPESSGLSPWLEELGLPRVGGVTTMIRGKPFPAAADAKVFSLVNQALG